MTFPCLCKMFGVDVQAPAPAPAPGAVAAAAQNGPSGQPAGAQASSSSKLGAIIGGVAGGMFLVTLVALATACIALRRRRTARTEQKLSHYDYNGREGVLALEVGLRSLAIWLMI